jgi:hypothetical protein
MLVHLGNWRLCIAVMSNLQKDTDITRVSRYEKDKSFNTVFHLWICSSIKNTKKLKYSVMRLCIWKVHLLHVWEVDVEYWCTPFRLQSATENNSPSYNVTRYNNSYTVPSLQKKQRSTLWPVKSESGHTERHSVHPPVAA